MQANEIMTRNVDTVNVGDKVTKAAVLMKKRDIGAVPVEDSGKIVGMITDRDITVRCVGDGREPDDTMVSDVMTPAVVSCRPDQDIAEVVHTMESKEVRRVLGGYLGKLCKTGAYPLS
ncbi:MAG: CBS domain-containing protein [Elusimicrobiales bacterium]|nr:CBS domain-containing protein [Elusimicrobiales bacterium]